MTRMVDIDTLLPRVMEKAAACPEPSAIRHLRDTAIDFCERARVWRWRDSFTITADACQAVAMPPQARVFEFKSVTFDGVPLEPVTVDWLDREIQNWRDEESPPRFVTQDEPGALRLVGKAAGTLAVEIVLKPAQDADEIPEFLAEDYGATLADGALGKVLLTPGDYSNPQLGAFHKSEYEKAVGKWADLAPKGQQRAPRRVRASFF